jgi:hypothetical protein
MQRAGAGQERRTGHAVRPADHGHIAVGPLVRRMGPRPHRRCARKPGRRRRRVGGFGQRVEPDLAGGVPTVRGEEARLQREQAEAETRRRTGLARVRRRAGVGVQPGRHVDGQDRRRATLHPPEPGGHRTVGRTTGADAQQGIDGQVVGRWRLAGERDAGVPGALVRRLRVRRQARFVAAERHDGGKAAPLQFGGGLETIAAVVAGAASDPDHAGMRCDRHREARHRLAGTLHQRVGGRAAAAPLRSAAWPRRRTGGTGGGRDALHGGCGSPVSAAARRSMPRPSRSTPASRPAIEVGQDARAAAGQRPAARAVAEVEPDARDAAGAEHRRAVRQHRARALPLLHAGAAA